MALELSDLVANGTCSPEMAATLASAAAARQGLLFVAIPRMAGKSTVMQAALRHAPAGTAFHRLLRSAGPGLGIPAKADGGYLLMSEIARTNFDDYLWGEEVRTAFAALRRGFSLATALHAPGLEEAFEIITTHNKVPDIDASQIGLVTYIRSLGDWSSPDRRVIENMWEVTGVTGGKPVAQLLHRWDERRDRFDVLAQPTCASADDDSYMRLVARFQQAAGTQPV